MKKAETFQPLNSESLFRSFGLSVENVRRLKKCKGYDISGVYEIKPDVLRVYYRLPSKGNRLLYRELKKKDGKISVGVPVFEKQ